MDEFKKAQKNVKNDMLVLAILELIIFIYELSNNQFQVLAIGLSVALFVGYLLAKKGDKKAGNMGILVGAAMMATLVMGGAGIVNCLLGIFVVMHSVRYNQLVKSE